VANPLGTELKSYNLRPLFPKKKFVSEILLLKYYKSEKEVMFRG
jgi:hypothetical protein